jgi:hypothetical protein
MRSGARPPAGGGGGGVRAGVVGRGRRFGPKGRGLFPEPTRSPPLTDAELEAALLAGKILAYSQGFTLLSRGTR